MELEINRLVKLIKKRKPEALNKVMDLYIGSVYNVAKSILIGLGSEEDIEECVQDVFLQAWDNIENFDPERGTFKTWLLILCKYRALNLRKSLTNNNKIIELEDRILTSKENLEENYLAKESKAEIIAAIKSFNAIDREVFLRRYILEQDIDDICSWMSLSRQAIDNRLWRGRKVLKELLSSTVRRSINE